MFSFKRYIYNVVVAVHFICFCHLQIEGMQQQFYHAHATNKRTRMQG